MRGYICGECEAIQVVNARLYRWGMRGECKGYIDGECKVGAEAI